MQEAVGLEAEEDVVAVEERKHRPHRALDRVENPRVVEGVVSGCGLSLVCPMALRGQTA